MSVTARQAAADILNRSRDRAGFAGDLIDAYLARNDLSPLDRRFVTQLVFGVIRRRATLDALITPFVRIPIAAVEARVWDALQLGAYQLAFLTQIPRHAAVNETVELATHIGSPKAKGFLNGVMRRVAELVTNDFTDTPAADAVPMDQANPDRKGGGEESNTPSLTLRVRHTFRRLTQPVLPDPAADTAAYFAAAFSWPRWLADRWLARWGPQECDRVGFWFNSPPPLWVRANKLHSDRETFRARLLAVGVESDPGPHPQSLHLKEHHRIRELPGYAEGAFAVQDHSSMLVASAVGVQPGMHVLDLCAAPGGKTTHLAELMDNRGRITACDIDRKRLDTIETLALRLGVKGIDTVLLNENDEPPDGPFDAALVDAPCSNTGVMGRRPEVRWRIRPNEFPHLIRLQTRLLIQAAERVRSGGVVVYSTCSIEPDENGGVVNAVRKALGLTLEAEHASAPGMPSDGGYWARLRKS